MRFYNRPHPYYCGIDLHVKTMYVCILDGAGQVLVHRNVASTPAAFLEVVAPYRTDLVVAAFATAMCIRSLRQQRTAAVEAPAPVALRASSYNSPTVFSGMSFTTFPNTTPGH